MNIILSLIKDSKEERYLVIIEKWADYNLLITAYYLEYDNALEKQLKHYNQFKKAKDASVTGTSLETPYTTSRWDILDILHFD